MRTLRCEVSYQGLPGKRLEFRRSPGLGSEFGSIDLDFADLRQLKIAGRDVPWRAVNGIEINGQTDIRSWAKIKPGTTAAPPDLPAPPGGGLNMFGTLTLRTIDHGTGAVVDEVSYKEVYVAAAGLEEVTEDLAQIEDHDKGTVRVPLTDVRWWMQKCGGLWSAINVRLKSGEWKRDTVQDGGTPWSLSEVVRFLFSQLPGSPSVLSSSELFGLSAAEAPPPSDIEGQGEPVIEHLQKLLDRYGLVAGLRPDATWTVDRKGSTKYGYKEGPDAGGGTRDLSGLDLHYEKKTSTVTDRPPAVCVTGGRRIRRISVPYVPVLEDVDGKVYRLEAVVRRWGYSMEKLNNNIFVEPDRQFRDIPPTISGSGGGRLHDKRVKLARRAYRMYAPAFLFDGASDSTEVAGGLSQDQVDACPFLPMKDAPWYISELGGQGLQIPKDAPRSKGDREDFVLMPPVARGCRIGGAWLLNFKEMENYFNAFIQSFATGVSLQEAGLSLIKLYEGKALESLVALSESADRTLSGAKASRFGAGSMLIDFDADTKKIAQDLGQTLKKAEWNDLLNGGYNTIQTLKGYDQMAQDAAKRVEGQRDQLNRWRERFNGNKLAFKVWGGVRVRSNIGYDLLESGSYSIDHQTGILQASEPLCQVNKAMFYDGDSATVVEDGKVFVTYAYELKDNTIAAFSSFLFTPAATDDEQPGRPVLAGVCKSSPLKARCEPMTGRLYEMDLGTPVNLNACASEAWQKAGGILGLPKVVTGYVYMFSGLYGFPLSGGVTGVQHTYDGEIGRTFLTINAPGARAPLGPPGLPKRDVATVDAREAFERER